MATSTHIALPQLLVLLLTLLVSSCSFVGGCFTSLFVFGDSYSDAGNNVIVDGSLFIDRPPYGMTYFGRPTGRLCDGRIIPDLIAEAFGLPFPPAYLGLKTNGQDARQGVNFAVTGATALDPSFFIERGLEDVWSNFTLSVQVRWFKELLSSLCSSESECRDFMGSALFYLGEIGLNDFNFPFMEGRNLTELQSYVPSVVDAITSTINELIELGARTLVVPGLFPIGCIPAHLTFYYEHPRMMKDEYDPSTGCIKKLNQLSEFYDLRLQEALDRLRKQNPRVTIIYANVYKASMMIFESPEKFGFDKTTLRVCCGGGGPYNFNESAKCGTPGSTVCNDPSRAVFWIRFHFSEAAYKFMTTTILEGPNAFPPFAHACSKISRNDHNFMLNVY